MAVEDEHADRRRFQRTPAECTILVRRLGNGSLPAVSNIKDIGLGGCMFEHDKRMGHDAILYLSILLEKRVVEAKGRVVYETPKEDGAFDIGVEFRELWSKDRETLKEICAELQRRKDNGSTPPDLLLPRHRAAGGRAANPQTILTECSLRAQASIRPAKRA